MTSIVGITENANGAEGIEPTMSAEIKRNANT